MAAGDLREAEERIEACGARLDPRTAGISWGEYLRVRGGLHERARRTSAARADYAQSINVFELLGERYQAALSRLALGRLLAESGSRQATTVLDQAAAVFGSLGATRDLQDLAAARAMASSHALGDTPPLRMDADDVIVRRLVDAADRKSTRLNSSH